MHKGNPCYRKAIFIVGIDEEYDLELDIYKFKWFTKTGSLPLSCKFLVLATIIRGLWSKMLVIWKYLSWSYSLYFLQKIWN